MSGLSKGLGKGFDSLMPTEFDQSLLLDKKDRVQKLLISRVEPNPDQPRHIFDQGSLNELAESIKRYGILQPLIVSPGEGDTYRIVAGERRWRAAKIAGFDTVPAIVRDRKELEELEIALIENVQRVDLAPLEQAVSIERLHQQFNLPYKDIAVRLGKSDATVSNIVRLLQLPKRAQDFLRDGQISEGHARAILALKHMPDKQDQLIDQIIKHGWSVRQAEQYVVGQREGADTKKAIDKRMATHSPETKRIEKRLKAPVSIRRTAKGGRLEIGFRSDEELTNILAILEKI